MNRCHLPLAGLLAASMLPVPATAQLQGTALELRVSRVWTNWLNSAPSASLALVLDARRRELLWLEGQPANESRDVTPFRVLGMGDSYAAGEGNPAAPGSFELFGQIRTALDTWHSEDKDRSAVLPRACHQSSENGLQRAVRQLRQDPLLSSRMRFEVHDVSCSGSAVADLINHCRSAVDDRQTLRRTTLDGSVSLAQQAPQIELFNRFRKASMDRLRGAPTPAFAAADASAVQFVLALQSNPVTGPIDAVTLSIGGNDAGFGQAVAGCAMSDCVPRRDVQNEPILPGHAAYVPPNAGVTNNALKNAILVMVPSLMGAAEVVGAGPSAAALTLVPGGVLVAAPLLPIAVVGADIAIPAVVMDKSSKKANDFVKGAHEGLVRLRPASEDADCQARPNALDCRFRRLDQALKQSVFGGNALETGAFGNCGLQDVNVPLPSGFEGVRDDPWRRMFERPAQLEQHVYIVKPPSPLQREDGSICRLADRRQRPDFLLDGVTDDETRFLVHDFIGSLHAAIDRTAVLGWNVVSEAAERSLGHSLCDAQPWVLDNVQALARVGARIPETDVNPLIPFSNRDFDGLMHIPIGGAVAHPNSAGWDSIGQALFNALRVQAIRKVQLTSTDRPARVSWRVQTGNHLVWDAPSSKADGYRVELRQALRGDAGNVVLTPWPAPVELGVFRDRLRNFISLQPGEVRGFEVRVRACQRVPMGSDFAEVCPESAASAPVRIGLARPQSPSLNKALVHYGAHPRLEVQLAASDLAATATELVVLPFSREAMKGSNADPAGLDAVLNASVADMPGRLRKAGGSMISEETRNDSGFVSINVDLDPTQATGGFIVATRQCSHTACSDWSPATVALPVR